MNLKLDTVFVGSSFDEIEVYMNGVLLGSVDDWSKVDSWSPIDAYPGYRNIFTKRRSFQTIDEAVGFLIDEANKHHVPEDVNPESSQ